MSMEKLNIGLDFSGVIADCEGLKREIVRRFFGKDVLRVKKDLVDKGLMTFDQYLTVKQKAACTREMGYRTKPVENVHTYLEILKNEGHSLKVVTSRYDISSWIAKEWMHLNCINIPIVSVGKGNDKADACRGLDVFVDDDVEKLEKLVGVVPNRFLFSWDYNKNVHLDGLAKRVNSWKDLYENILDLATNYTVYA